MYGLVIESIVAFIRKTYGDDKWMEIRRLGKIEQHSFSTHLIYPETTIPRLVETASELLGVSREELLTQLGRFFVTFVSQYGYDKILRVLGRHMRDFLNGLDNLHEYMRFSYPKLKPPSFFVEKETEHGLMLHYRSKRRYGGYVRYVMGQIKSVGETFYGLDIDIELVKEEFIGNMVHVTMQLRFDNAAFLTEWTAAQDVLDELPIESDLFFEAFPFHIVFTEDMIIKSAGSGLSNVIPSIEGHDISHIFLLRRPMVEFGWDQVLSHTNNVFELESVDSIHKKGDGTFSVTTIVADNEQEEIFANHKASEGDQSDFMDMAAKNEEGMKLHLKGQMIYTPEWQATLFLGTPVLPHLVAMFDTGLYINDLSLHDNSRDLVLAGTQTSAELKLALDQEQIKSKKLEDNMKKLDEEMRRTDELLYQMIPRQIADRLRAGEPALDTCQIFDHVTMLFSDVVGFTIICSRISPLQVVNMLNAMYSKFDNLCALHETYKVETIGDAYVVVSGAPEEVNDHAERIADMSLGMIGAMTELVDPSTGNHLQIRVGINSGVVVAGVVGLKMPRYCLFGDTVNTAAKMESSSEHMKIQMTQATMGYIRNNPKYIITERGEILVKDKGKMFTYYLAPSEMYVARVSIVIPVEKPMAIPRRQMGRSNNKSNPHQTEIWQPSTTNNASLTDGIADIDTNNSAEIAPPRNNTPVNMPPPRRSSIISVQDHKPSLHDTPVLIFDSKANSRNNSIDSVSVGFLPPLRNISPTPTRSPSPRSVKELKVAEKKAMGVSPPLRNMSPAPARSPSPRINGKRATGISSPDIVAQPASKKSTLSLRRKDSLEISTVQREAKELNGKIVASKAMKGRISPVVDIAAPFREVGKTHAEAGKIPHPELTRNRPDSLSIDDQKIEITPSDSPISAYEEGDAGASTSETVSPSESMESIEINRTDSMHQEEPFDREPVFTIRPEDHVARKKTPRIMAAKRPVKNELVVGTPNYKRQMVLPKFVPVKTLMTEFPRGGRRGAIKVGDEVKTAAPPTITVTGLSEAQLEKRNQARIDCAIGKKLEETNKALHPLRAVVSLDHESPRKASKKKEDGSHKLLRKSSVRDKLDEMLAPRKTAEVIIDGSSTPPTKSRANHKDANPFLIKESIVPAVKPDAIKESISYSAVPSFKPDVLLEKQEDLVKNSIPTPMKQDTPEKDAVPNDVPTDSVQGSAKPKSNRVSGSQPIKQQSVGNGKGSISKSKDNLEKGDMLMVSAKHSEATLAGGQTPHHTHSCTCSIS